MTRPIVAFLLLAAHALAAPYIWMPYEIGARTAFPGRSLWLQTSARYAITVSCDPDTDTCTNSSGYTVLGTETGTFYADGGTLPSGIWGTYGGNTAPYALCNPSGGAFEIWRNTCAGTRETWTTAGSGTIRFRLDGYAHVYYTANSGWPSGSTVTFHGMQAAGCMYNALEEFGVYFTWNAAPMCWQITIPSNATPGVYPISMTFATDRFGANPFVYQYNLTVTAVSPPAITRPSTFPTIPDLSQWESTMTGSSYWSGGYWCNNMPKPLNFSQEGQIWYYDGVRNYLNAWTYTGNAHWRDDCALPIAQQYRDYLQQYGMPGHRYFHRGLIMADQVWPGEGYDTEEHIANGAINYTAMMADSYYVYVQVHASASDGPIREHSYALDWWADVCRYYGACTDPGGEGRMESHADGIIGMLLMYVDGTSRYRMNQTLYNGLALDALIRYWWVTQDARVPYIVKLMLDKMWTEYDQAKHIQMYNPDPDGPKCNMSATWFQSDISGGCQQHVGQSNQNLVSNAFAWYWRVSGDDTYRVRGDDWFAYGLDEEMYGGKQWNQSYMLSFDFVGYRNGTIALPGEQIAAVSGFISGSTVISGGIVIQ